MTPTIEFDLDGGSILVEVDGPAPEGVTLRGGVASGDVVKAKRSLEGVVKGMGPLLRTIVEQFGELEASPAEVELEFALKVSADAGLIIARTGGEANFRVLVRWSRP